MPLHDLPDHGPMLFAPAAAYHEHEMAAARAAAAHVGHVLDLPYGEETLQKLDIWRPASAGGGPLPVVFFIHGGAFRNGYKEWIGAMAPLVTSMPALLVSPDYRLVPAVTVADCLDDCRAALAWVRRNIAQHGGDPDKIILGGHSAGAYLAAMLAVTSSGSSNCIAVSGLYGMEREDFQPGSIFHENHAEFVGKDQTGAALSVWSYLDGAKGRFSLINGENELPEVATQTERFVRQCDASGINSTLSIIPGADHFDAHTDCNAEGSAFERALRVMLS